MNKLEKLKRFLQENYPNIQAFNTKNDADDIQVDYCFGYDYIEIFGLNEEEFESLLDKDSLLGDNLRDFIVGKDYPKEVNND